MKNTTLEVVEMMFKISRLMKSEMSFSNDLMHLSALQIQTLIFLNQNKETTMSDIAGYFHIEMPSATSLLNKLYNRKLVERAAVDQDRRLVRVTLSEKGKLLLDQVVQERKKKLEKTLSCLSDKEKSDFLVILKILLAGLQH